MADSVAVRARAWRQDQTALSLATLSAGAAGLVLATLGPLVLITLSGWTPVEEIVETIQGTTHKALLRLALALGLAAAVAALVTYRRMPTKHARESTVSGGALGLQAVLFSALFLWFIGGEKLSVFVQQFFDFELLGDFGGQFLNGAKNTVLLAFFGEALGIVIGLVFSLLILSKRVVVRAPARAYINFFRGTPLLWQLSFFSFGIVLGLRLDLEWTFFGVQPSQAYIIAVLILGLNAGAYTAEIFRAGIQSIERGQMEAARSLGMSYPQAMAFVMLPQAVRRVIPPLTNEFVILIKDTSLISILGLTFAERELLTVGRDAYSTVYNATPFLASAAGYLAVTLPMLRAVTWLERKLRSGLTGIAGQ